LWITFFVISGRAEGWSAGMLDPAALVFLSPWNVAAVLVGGMAVGALGGFIAARSAREIAD